MTENLNLKEREHSLMGTVQSFFKKPQKYCSTSTSEVAASKKGLQTIPQKTLNLLDRAFEKGARSPDLWRLKGLNLMQINKFLEANHCFDEVIRIAPNDGEILGKKGYCLFKLGHFEAALSCYKHALNLRPRDPEILTNTGICLCKLSRYAEALKCFDKALKNGGDCLTIWNNKGFCLAKMHLYKEAYATYKTALDHCGKDSFEILCNLAATLVGLKAYKEALYYFDRALQINSEDHLLLNNVAMCLAEQERYDLALQCYEKALRYAPDEPAYLHNKGICLTRMKRYKEAQNCFEEVIKHKPDNNAAWSELAAVHLAQGDTEKALFCFNKAMGLEA